MDKKILVVDDEKKLRTILKAFLEKEGFVVKTAADGHIALEIINNSPPDLVVLDLMLPGLSGQEVCQSIRRKMGLPIIMLTARGEEEDKINGFKYGADDYLVKPFSPRELVARIKAILRRSDYQAQKADVYIFQKGKIKIYPEEMRVEVDGKDTYLTTTEFDILYFLSRHPGQVISREQLIEQVMGLEYRGFDRTIDAHIKNIRKKIKLEKNKLIKTIYGAGYKFEGE